MDAKSYWITIMLIVVIVLLALLAWSFVENYRVSQNFKTLSVDKEDLKKENSDLKERVEQMYNIVKPDSLKGKDDFFIAASHLLSMGQDVHVYADGSKDVTYLTDFANAHNIRLFGDAGKYYVLAKHFADANKGKAVPRRVPQARKRGLKLVQEA